MKFSEFEWSNFIMGIIVSIICIFDFIYFKVLFGISFLLVLILGLFLVISPVLKILNLQEAESIVRVLVSLMFIFYALFQISLQILPHVYTGLYSFMGFLSTMPFYLFHFNEISSSPDKEPYDISILNNSLNLNNSNLDFIGFIKNGTYQFQIHNYDEALKNYNKAILINPNDEYLWNVKGVTLTELNNSYGAIRDFEKAIAINPKFKRAWINKGSALNDLNQNEKALEAYDTAIKIDPNYADAWDWRSFALICMNRYEEAINSSNIALDINPNNANAWGNKGIALIYLKKNKEALKAFDHAIEIDPYFSPFWTVKGTALYKMGLIDEAAQAYDRANMIEKIQLNRMSFFDFLFSSPN